LNNLDYLDGSDTNLTDRAEWHALIEHHQQTRAIHMRDQFKNDPERFSKFSIDFNDILFDYSKNRIDANTISLLIKLANACNLPGKINSMFAGEKINTTENRAVLHTALRSQETQPLLVDGIDIRLEIKNELTKIKTLSEKVRCQSWRGCTNQAITDVVNIGIGGSHLGPQMVTEALKPFISKDLNMHFVANIDENDIADTLAKLNPETTLFIICSKTFTTQETMLNATTAKNWFLDKVKDNKQLAKHFIAVSTNQPAALEFGIDENNIFTMWDWVGGRYSLWSAIGISIAIAIGFENFEQFLAGAYEADEHFVNTPIEKNIPALMGLLGIWYNNFYQCETISILPYSQHLHRFPSYLQQADMESNGKAVSVFGKNLSHSTGPIVFGELGNPAQHAFYQLLHQGTKLVPIDVLAAASNIDGQSKHQDALIANLFAQTEALMRGKTDQEVETELSNSELDQDQINDLISHKIFEGNRPSNTFLFEQLNPKTLGSIIAFYEHKVFVQGVIWNINSFDQWGVELGKQLAKTILNDFDNETLSEHDSSTLGLMKYYKRIK